MLTIDIALAIIMFWLMSFIALKLTGSYDLFTFAFCGCTSTVLFVCAFAFSRFLAGLIVLG